MGGPDRRRIYNALKQHQDEIDSRLGGNVTWGQEEGYSLLMLETEAAVPGPEEDRETARQWMAGNLIRLRDTLQPYLDQAMGGPGAGQDGAEDAGQEAWQDDAGDAE